MDGVMIQSISCNCKYVIEGDVGNEIDYLGCAVSWWMG